MKNRATPEQETTRQAILRTAERNFAAKGFEGARVEEIAREAGVNQATIYYYFKSKEDLFNAVIDGRVEDAQKFRREMKAVMPAPEILSRQVLDFVLEQRDFLKILLLETLTSSERNHWIFRLMDFIRTDGERDRVQSNDRNHEKTKLARFYFALLPSAAFSVFHDQWSQYFDSDLAHDKECFVEILRSSAVNMRRSLQT